MATLTKQAKQVLALTFAGIVIVTIIALTNAHFAAQLIYTLKH